MITPFITCLGFFLFSFRASHFQLSVSLCVSVSPSQILSTLCLSLSVSVSPSPPCLSLSFSPSLPLKAEPLAPPAQLCQFLIFLLFQKLINGVCILFYSLEDISLKLLNHPANQLSRY